MIPNIPKLLNLVYRNITERMDVAVVGMSGGADSTLCAILCREALGAANVYSLHMPMTDRDRSYFNANSMQSAEFLGIHRKVVPIEPIVTPLNAALADESWASAVPKAELTDTNLGNSRARTRMCLLYGTGHHLGTVLQKRVRVIGTGNLSEDYIGYDTKGGDALGDLFIIGELFKSEVYQLLDHFRDTIGFPDKLIDRVPSAGLWQGQTDEGELGYSYNEMEGSIRKLMLEGKQPETELDKFVANRHTAHKHKHEAPPVIALRDHCD